MRRDRDWKVLAHPMLPPRSETGAFVYFAWCDDPMGHVKIGYAQSLAARLSDMQTGCPYILRMVAWFKSENPKQDEMTLHYNFASYGVRGEWFRIGPLLEETIRKLRNEMRESLFSALISDSEDETEESTPHPPAEPRRATQRRRVEHFPVPSRNNASWEWRGKVRSS